MIKYLDKGQRIVRDKKFPFSVTLPYHEDHPKDKYGRYQPHGDPRKAWLYSGVTGGNFSVEDSANNAWQSSKDRIYRFAKEEDLMMFQLRWC